MSFAENTASTRWTPGGQPDRLINKPGAIGRSLPRIDGPQKVTGRARFAAEVPREGLTYAAIVTSTIARGRIVSLDISSAEAAPGVMFVMTHKNAPKMEPPALFMTSPRAAGASSLPVMQDDSIHWNGEPIVLVLAETQEQADYAAFLVKVSYAAEPARTHFDDAKTKARRPETVLGQPPVIEIGDAEAALASAPHRVDRAYRTPRHSHNAIEPHALTCWWEGDDLVLHDASQVMHMTQWTLAGVFGIDEARIEIHSPYVGGGFGGKTMWHHHYLGVAASKLSGRPVRVTLSRENVYRMVGGRTNTEQRVALGAKADGTLAAMIHTGVTSMTPYNDLPEQFTFPIRHLYRTDTLFLEQKVADIDMVANTFMRAPGESVGSFALESALDELAEALGLDPIELRRRIEPESDPTSDRRFSMRNLVKCYADGAERFGWAKRSPIPGARREGDWLIGMGVATATYPYFRLPGAVARIKLAKDGRATVASAMHEMGMGTATVQTQAAADRLGLPFENVEFQCGSTTLSYFTMAGGSSQTATISAAIHEAALALTAELVKLAGNDSPLAGLSPEEVELRDGGLGCMGDAKRFESYASILSRAQRDDVTVEGESPEASEMMNYSMHSYGAQFCEVRVNAVTGEPRVTRFLGAFDCGRILNPRTAASQFRGGIIMGLGLALMEETLFDERTGRIMNPSLAEYHVPTHMDVPEIDVIWTDIPDPHSPLGLHGIGEIGITGVGAAVANAVYNATGKRIRDLPITLDKVLAAPIA